MLYDLVCYLLGFTFLAQVTGFAEALSHKLWTFTDIYAFGWNKFVFLVVCTVFGIQYENNIDITLVISFLLINVFPRSWTSLVCHGLLVSRAQEAQNRRERELAAEDAARGNKKS